MTTAERYESGNWTPATQRGRELLAERKKRRTGEAIRERNRVYRERVQPLLRTLKLDANIARWHRLNPFKCLRWQPGEINNNPDPNGLMYRDPKGYQDWLNGGDLK